MTCITLWMTLFECCLGRHWSMRANVKKKDRQPVWGVFQVECANSGGTAPRETLKAVRSRQLLHTVFTPLTPSPSGDNCTYLMWTFGNKKDTSDKWTMLQHQIPTYISFWRGRGITPYCHWKVHNWGFVCCPGCCPVVCPLNKQCYSQAPWTPGHSGQA